MKRRSLHLVSWLAVAGLSVVPAGCGSDPNAPGKLIPVTGKVLIAGQPLLLPEGAEGSVSFRPDETKGNTSTFEPVGIMDREGNYQLKTAGKAGAPPGWYKVGVAAGFPLYITDRPTKEQREQMAKPPKSLIDRKYETVQTSGLAIEVVENPESGAYDLKLTK